MTRLQFSCCGSAKSNPNGMPFGTVVGDMLLKKCAKSRAHMTPLKGGNGHFPTKNGLKKFDFFRISTPGSAKPELEHLSAMQRYSPYIQLHTAYRHYPWTAWVRPEVCIKGRRVHFWHYRPCITGHGGKIAKT